MDLPNEVERQRVAIGPAKSHLSRDHPLAQVAARLCRAHLGPVRRLGIGQVACGACWERAIRDDERFAVEFGLPRELLADPDLVDEIAIERACRGELVRLTPVERATAVAELAGRGWGPTLIARRLRRSHTEVVRLLATAQADAAEAPGTGSGVAA